MEKNPYLYDGINIYTIPKSIYAELISNSNDRSYKSYTNDNGERITDYGEFNPPMFIYFDEPYNFHINTKHYDYLENKLIAGICFDENYNKVTKENIYSFYKYYNDGFLKGYNEFENSLKQNSSLFNIANDQIAYKIYSRIVGNGFLKKDGFMKLGSLHSPITEFETKMFSENNCKSILKITEERFFESGFEGGEFYKAWEIILNNSTLFEPIFLKNSNIEVTPELEAIVLNNASTIEKAKVFDPNHFNEDCHNLFNYLVDNYTKKGKVKFINIYYFLKDEIDKQKYSFNFIQDDYTIFIKANQQIEIKKYQKAEYDFTEQKRILNSHEEQFRKQ